MKLLSILFADRLYFALFMSVKEYKSNQEFWKKDLIGFKVGFWVFVTLVEYYT